jgi:general secretion pathway protein F
MASGVRGGLTLEAWLAFNREITALAGAGLPLERGLDATAGGWGGSVGTISRSIAERLERGESLDSALGAERESLPPLYRAVVEAGLRSGRLPAALESLTQTLEDQIEMRRAVALALLYPLILLSVAYGLFVGFVILVAPRFASVFRDFRLPAAGILQPLDWLGRTVIWWGPLVPLAVVAASIAWSAMGRARGFGNARAGRWLRLVPWARPLLADSAASSFAGLLGLLVDHGVGLDEAVKLAGAASGDEVIRAESIALAEGIRRGDAEAAVKAAARPGGLPALLGWMLVSGCRRGAIVESMRHAADVYRRRTLARAETMRTVLPIVLMATVGGVAVLAYGLLLFVPMSTLLRDLSGAN